MQLTEEQQKILLKVEERRKKRKDSKIFKDGEERTVEKQRLRSAVQGATLGFGEEIEAGLRSLLPGSEPYNEIRDILREKLSVYKKEHPTEAFGYELAGGILPALIPGGGTATLGKLAARSALEGTVAGAGYSEADSVKDFVEDVGMGTAIGAGVGTGVGFVGKKLGNLGEKVLDWTRTKLGDKASTVVQAELKRLQQITGKNTDEIIEDVIEGKTLSDNRTLAVAIKGLANEGGLAGKEIREKADERAKKLTDKTISSIHEELAPGFESNIIRGFKKSDEELHKLEKEAYEKVIGAKQPAGDEVAKSLEDVIQRMPSVRNTLGEIYAENKSLVPLFTTRENGSIELVRQPTLEDGEIAYRILRDTANKLYRGSEGTKAEIYAISAKELKEQLDDFSPELKKTRKEAAMRRNKNESFKEGEKSLRKDLSQLHIDIEEMEKLHPSILESFRLGAMASIKNQAKRNKTTISKLADEDTQLGEAIRAILPKQEQKTLNLLEQTAAAKDLSQRLPITHGSPTQPLQMEQSQRGLFGHLGEITGALSGDLGSLVTSISNRIKKKTPSLSDEERQQIASLLFEENPEILKAALEDETLFKHLSDHIMKQIYNTGNVFRLGSVQQAIQMNNE